MHVACINRLYVFSDSYSIFNSRYASILFVYFKFKNHIVVKYSVSILKAVKIKHIEYTFLYVDCILKMSSDFQNGLLFAVDNFRFDDDFK